MRLSLFFLIELCLTLVAMGIAFALPTLSEGWFARWEEQFRRLAKRRVLSVLLVGFSALALRAALLPTEPIPIPGVQDEFSYLLAADTFAHRRLANPPHPLWQHFETFAELQQPTYASKYPPAQGLTLAIAELVGVKPFWGVWLSIGLMCAAICWMLQAWMPEGWALLGSLFAVIRIGTFSYWANSYWGGAIAATGGALLLGALPRIQRRRNTRDALILAAGVAILANSRPYEGMVFCLIPLAVLTIWLVKLRGENLRSAIQHTVIPAFVVLLATAVAMAYYFKSVTGSPFVMPYQAYQAAYDPMPYLIWQPRPVEFPAYRHPTMLAWEIGRFNDWGGGTLPGFFTDSLLKMVAVALFYFGPVFVGVCLFAVAAGPYDLHWRQLTPNTRLLLTVAGLMLVSFMLEAPRLVHYVAPMTCVIVALMMLALRYLSGWSWRGAPTGLAFCRAVSIALVTLFIARAAVGRAALDFPLATWCATPPQDAPNLDRAEIATKLQAMRNKQLVIVQYSPRHLTSREWVYNDANIDGSQVVWAQDMGPEKNQELIDYYKDRQVWLLLADNNPPRIVPYRPSGKTSADAFEGTSAQFTEYMATTPAPSTR